MDEAITEIEAKQILEDPDYDAEGAAYEILKRAWMRKDREDRDWMLDDMTYALREMVLDLTD